MRLDPIVVFALILVLVFGGATIALHSETKKAGGLKSWLADLPTTNFRIFMSIILATFYVIVTMLLTVMVTMEANSDRILPDVVLDTIGLFLIGMMGIDAASYIAKRITHRKYATADDDGSNDPQPPPESPPVTTVRTEVNVPMQPPIVTEPRPSE